MGSLGRWYDTVAEEVAAAQPQQEAEQAAEPVQAQPAQPRPVAQPVRPAPAMPTREALQQGIARHEANMRAPENSPEWKSYWREGGNAAYLAALQAIETAQGSAATPPLARRTTRPDSHSSAIGSVTRPRSVTTASRHRKENRPLSQGGRGGPRRRLLSGPWSD
jgi:hypothetical protein